MQLVLLSGGLDSAVALFHTLQSGRPTMCMFVDYGQVAGDAELRAAHEVGHIARQYYNNMSRGFITTRQKDLFCSLSSILGKKAIDQYKTVEEAILKTPDDASYIPLRNTVLVTLAAHALVSEYGSGEIILGIRSRAEKNAPAGFPDCSHDFARIMTEALRLSSGKTITVRDPLNVYANSSREETIRMALRMPGCFQALAHTVTCFKGAPACGHCLPCLRRAQAFEKVTVLDPALVKD